MTTIYADWRRINAESVYDAGGYYLLVEACRDLFGIPIVGGGYRVMRKLERDEAVTYVAGEWQGLQIIMPEVEA